MAKNKLKDERQITTTYLKDIVEITEGNNKNIRYHDDELVIMEDVHELPDISTHEVAFNMVVACMSGQVTLDVSGEPKTLRAGQLFVCHSHSILSDINIYPDFDAKIMCISDRLLRNILQRQMIIWNKMLYHQHCRIIDVSPSHFVLYSALRHHWYQTGSPFKTEILVCLLRVAFLELCEQILNEHLRLGKENESASMSRMETIFNNFIQNMAHRHVKKQSVAQYAEELCITPKYLSTVCRTVSGKSASEWISEYVVEDIVHYLKRTDLTARQIASELGFPNASFFTRYVHDHLGMSTRDFRKELMKSKRTANLAKRNTAKP